MTSPIPARRTPTTTQQCLGAAAALIAAGAASGQCNQWSAGPGLNGAVEAAILWDPDGTGPLAARPVVGGTFTMSGTTNLGRVAMWNGTGWSPMSSGMDGPVLALAVFNNELYAGGNFVNASGSQALKVARWTGAVWQPVGGGITGGGVVSSLGVYNGQLFAGGTFSGVPAGNRITRLVSGTWTPVGSGTDAVVWAFGEWNGSMVVCGDFSLAGGVLANRLALWTGAGGGTWSAFSPPLVAASGLNSATTTQVFNGQLIAGGAWFDGTGAITPCVARFTGTAWQRMGNGFTNTCESLAVYLGSLHAGGAFLQSGPTVLNRVARWDGSNWQPLDGGVNGVVRAIVPFNSELWVFGSFSQAGPAGSPVAVENWARWRGQVTPTIVSQPQPFEVDQPPEARFEVTVNSPAAPVTYQWRRNGTPIINGFGGASPGGGDVDGAVADELIIRDVRWSDAGLYDCVISSACGGVTSASVALTYPGACPPDINQSGTLTVQDIFDFLAAYFAGQPGGDFNGSGMPATVQDIFDFLAAYFAGC